MRSSVVEWSTETERTVSARGVFRIVLCARCGTQITGCVGNEEEEEEDDCERRGGDRTQKEAV